LSLDLKLLTFSLFVLFRWEVPPSDEDNGGGGDESDGWYLGSQPSFRANVAFSLYGILKGEKNTGCNKKTFINSFHTTQGVESFTNAMVAAGLDNLFDYYGGEDNENGAVAVTSTCYQNENNGGDGDDNMDNGAKYDANAVSYGVGCSVAGDHSFAIQTYQGGYCDGNAILEVEDDLQDFNDRLELSKCVPIYTQGDYYSYGEDGGGDEDVSSPLAVLETSIACDIHDGTGTCPDPYGKIKQYDHAVAVATGSIEPSPWWTPRRVKATSWSMISLGILAALIGFAVIAFDCCNKDKLEEETDDDSTVMKALARGRSELSQLSATMAHRAKRAANLASRISHGDLGFGRSSKKSKKSKASSKKTARSSSKKSHKSTKSGKSNKSGKSKSNKSSVSKRSSHSGKEVVELSRDRTEQSNLSDFSDSQHSYDDEEMQAEEPPTLKVTASDDMDSLPDLVSAGEKDLEYIPNEPTSQDEEQTSVASARLQPISELVHFFQTKSKEFFDKEASGIDTNESFEYPPASRIPESLPKSQSRQIEAEVESSICNAEAVSKEKYKKRKWFRRLLGRK
jgi:hypothetical protein